MPLESKVAVVPTPTEPVKLEYFKAPFGRRIFALIFDILCMVFAVLFDYQGIINFIFHLGSTPWIDQAAPTWRAMIALCIYIIWHSLPFKILIFLSGLQNIDKQYYDAAKIDCAGKWRTMLGTKTVDAAFTDAMANCLFAG